MRKDTLTVHRPTASCCARLAGRTASGFLSHHFSLLPVDVRPVSAGTEDGEEEGRGEEMEGGGVRQGGGGRRGRSSELNSPPQL